VGGILTLDSKQVDMRDGKFELLLVRAPRDLLEISDCIRALQTQKYNCAMMTFLSTSRLTVYASPEMPWSLDGERQEGSDKILVENLHHAIALMKRE
jgi:diacylglycerol kinase family enzyme